MHTTSVSANALPDENGFFGTFGGRFVAETLMPLLIAVTENWHAAKADQSFWDQLDELSRTYVGGRS